MKNFVDNTLDETLSSYVNTERLSSITQPNLRALRLSKTESNTTTSDFRDRCFSLSSSNHSSTKPIIPISVSRIKKNDKEPTVGNPHIRPPTRQAHEETDNRSYEIKTSGAVKVTRIKSTEKQTTSARTMLDSARTNDRRGSNVQVTRVHSVPSNMKCISSLDESTLSVFEDTIHLDDSNESKQVSDLTRQPYQLTAEKRDVSSAVTVTEILPNTLKSKSSVASATNHTRVQRIETKKPKKKARNSVSLSLVVEEIQKKKINQHNGVQVEHISRKNTA